MSAASAGASAANRRPAREQWGIVGGGMLGMTLAHRLTRRGQRVTLLEAAGSVGGLAGAWTLGDVVWDRHYHVTLLSDLALRSLLRDLGLEEEMRWRYTRTGFYADGRLHSLSSAREFLTFPLLGPLDKLRLALTILRAARIGDGRSLDGVAATDWLRRWSGRRVLEAVWVPLLRAKLGDGYRRASAVFIWATIARMYAARRSGLKREMFGYVTGGYARVLARFEETLRSAGVTVKRATPVRRVERDPEGGLRVVTAHGEGLRFDRVVVTTPAPVAARLCPDLTPGERALLHGVDYQGIVCASVLLRRPLAEYYVTNILDPGVPFTGVIEMSALVDRRQFGGAHLVYLPKYVPPAHPLLDTPDTEIRDRFLTALERMYPRLTPSDVLAFRVSRAPHVFALPTIGYRHRLPPMATSVPGLALVSSAHLLDGTLNVNETVALAERAVDTLWTPMTRRHLVAAG